MKIIQTLLEFTSVIAISASLGVTIGVFLYLQDIQAKHVEEVGLLKAQVAQQKNDKDQISYLWEEQAAQNDNLIREQTIYQQEVQAFLAEIENSIRFVQGSAQTKSTANEERFVARRDAVTEQSQSLEEQTKTAVDAKDSSKAFIDQLYLERGEDLKNRANPKQGIRTE